MKEIVQNLFSNTSYLSHRFDNGELILEIESVQKAAKCPYCQKSSAKVHSRYLRKFTDLPIQGHPTMVFLHCRKFFCKNDKCQQLTFCENFDFILPNEAKTERLISTVLSILNNNSSRKTSAILADQGIKISKATICNLKKKKIS
ncbi:MAG: transposase family protein [Bacilli bacterium]|nr:transposase family protein [Bacilli bacterium]